MTVLAGRRQRPDDALKYSLRAHDLFQLAGHRAGQALVLNDRRSISCYQRAIERYTERADRFNEADTLISLGDVWLTLGQTDTACQVWRQALTIFEEIGHPDREGVQTRLARARTESHAS